VRINSHGGNGGRWGRNSGTGSDDTELRADAA
jgi:hypothetical protein